MRAALKVLVLAGALLFGVSAPAHAVVIVPVDGSWVEFFFGGAGDALPSFQIDALTPISFTVVDGYLSGDRFALTGLGATSAPLSTGEDIGDNFNAALSDPRWSSGVFFLPPGNHLVTGTVTSSPFGFGSAAVRAQTAPDVAQPTVPEPGTWLLLTFGLVGWGAQRRLTARNRA